MRFQALVCENSDLGAGMRSIECHSSLYFLLCIQHWLSLSTDPLLLMVLLFLVFILPDHRTLPYPTFGQTVFSLFSVEAIYRLHFLEPFWASQGPTKVS